MRYRYQLCLSQCGLAVTQTTMGNLASTLGRLVGDFAKHSHWLVTLKLCRVWTAINSASIFDCSFRQTDTHTNPHTHTHTVGVTPQRGTHDRLLLAASASASACTFGYLCVCLCVRCACSLACCCCCCCCGGGCDCGCYRRLLFNLAKSKFNSA